jgi:hypothetical protein
MTAIQQEIMKHLRPGRYATANAIALILADAGVTASSQEIGDALSGLCESGAIRLTEYNSYCCN